MSKRISTLFAETLKTVREGVTNGIDAFVRQRLKDAGNSDNAGFNSDGDPIIDLETANSLITLD